MKVKSTSDSAISLELAEENLSLMISSLVEIHELCAYAGNPLHAEYGFQFDFKETVGISMAEAAKMTDNLCLLRHGPGPVWTVVFTREELQAIVNAIRKLLDPHSPLLEELFTRTGFHESEFSAFAQQIVAVLDKPQDPVVAE